MSKTETEIIPTSITEFSEVAEIKEIPSDVDSAGGASKSSSSTTVQCDSGIPIVKPTEFKNKSISPIELQRFEQALNTTNEGKKDEDEK
ncbi:unnamed protein product, partial [marine sediment metagenome]